MQLYARARARFRFLRITGARATLEFSDIFRRIISMFRAIFPISPGAEQRETRGWRSAGANLEGNSREKSSLLVGLFRNSLVDYAVNFGDGREWCKRYHGE